MDSGAIRFYRGKVVISEAIENRQETSIEPVAPQARQVEAPCRSWKTGAKSTPADATTISPDDATISAADAMAGATLERSDATEDDALDDELGSAIAAGKLVSFSDAQRFKENYLPADAPLSSRWRPAT